MCKVCGWLDYMHDSPCPDHERVPKTEGFKKGVPTKQTTPQDIRRTCGNSD